MAHRRGKYFDPRAGHGGADAIQSAFLVPALTGVGRRGGRRGGGRGGRGGRRGGGPGRRGGRGGHRGRGGRGGRGGRWGQGLDYWWLWRAGVPYWSDAYYPTYSPTYQSCCVDPQSGTIFCGGYSYPGQILRVQGDQAEVAHRSGVSWYPICGAY